MHTKSQQISSRICHCFEIPNDESVQSLDALVEFGYLTNQEIELILTRGYTKDEILSQVLQILLEGDACDGASYAHILTGECLCNNPHCRAL